MTGLPMYVVEAFTIGANQAFSGNTASICVLDFDNDISDELKQKIGMQMNLAETAFISQGWTKSGPFNSTKTNRWTLRWFTPTVEIELCGHATLAAANVLFNQIMKKQGLVDTEKVKETTVVFETKFKGKLEATMNWSTGHIALNFPANAPVPLASVPDNDSELWLNQVIAEVLGPSVSTSLVDDVQVATGLKFVLIRLKNTGDPERNREQLAQIVPNFRNLTSVKTGRFELLGVVVTTQGWADTQVQGQAKDKPQFYSRVIVPWVGIDEDPVTGAAHTILTPYWLQQFMQQGVSLKGDNILGLQLSARKGKVLCSMSTPNRVKMVGQSRLTMSGEFYPN